MFCGKPVKMDKQKILSIVSDIFNKYSVEYALIGAYAASAWGVVRATKDIDFITHIPPESVEDIKKEFAANGFDVEVIKGDVKDPISGVIKLICKGSYGKEVIDVILGIRGISMEVYKRVIDISVFGVRLPVLSPEDIIISKLIAGSPVDLDDAKKIVKIMDERIDFKYLEEQCEKKKLSLAKIR
jgi:hypothetical protein